MRRWHICGGVNQNKESVKIPHGNQLSDNPFKDIILKQIRREMSVLDGECCF